MNRYEEIANDIINKVHNNIIQQGDQLDKEELLCKEYNCSKITIKKALGILAQKGLVFRQRGSGTYINANAKFWLSFNQTNLLGHKRGNEHLYHITTKVTLFEIIIPPRNVSTLLNIPETQYTYHFKRIRLHNDIASLLEESYVPLFIIDNLTSTALENSLFELIQSSNDNKIQSIHKVISMVPASFDVAAALNVKENEITAHLEEVNYLNSSIAFEYSIISQNYRDFNFYSVIQNN